MFPSVLKPVITPTIRQISIQNFYAIFNLNRSRSKFEKSIDCWIFSIYPDYIFNNFNKIDSLQALNIPKVNIRLSCWIKITPKPS